VTRGYWLAPVALAAAVAACAPAGPTGPSAAELELRTEREAYVAERLGDNGVQVTYRVSVVTVLENRGQTRVSIARCNPDSPHPLYGVGLVDAPAGARAAYGGVWACVGHDRPIRLDPGQSRTDTLRLLGSQRRGTGPGEPVDIVAGEMRVRYFLEDCRGGGCGVPVGTVDSNVFTVATDAAQ
jgi:hypothetical protein